MIRYLKGDTVKKGYYLSLSKGEVIGLEKDGKIPDSAYGALVKFPAILAIIAAPFVGVIYLMFLPITGIVAAMILLVMKIVGLGKSSRNSRPVHDP